MPDEHDNQPASVAGTDASPGSTPEPAGELTAAQRRAKAMAEGKADAQTEPTREEAGRRGFGLRRKPKKSKKKYDSILAYFWGEWIRPLGQILLVVMTIRLVAVDWFDVPTGSMEPTIMVGDRILVHKWVYGIRVPFSKESWIVKWGTPERGDIVVCYSPDEGDEVRLVKRLVAQGGDTVELREGRLIINGQAAGYEQYEPSESMVQYLIDNWDQDSINRASAAQFFTETVPADANGPGDEHAVVFDAAKPGIRNVPPFQVPADHFVVIGDNRDNSKDSRQWNLDQNEWGTSFGILHERRVHGRAFAVAFSLDKSNFYVPRITRTGRPLR